MKGESNEESTSVPPAKTARASEIEGREGSRAAEVGISWVNSLALALVPFTIPSFKLMLNPHSEATSTQFWVQMPLGASGVDLIYAVGFPTLQCEVIDPPLTLAWYSVEQLGDRVTRMEHIVYVPVAEVARR